MKIYELTDIKTKNIYNIDALTWLKKQDVEKYKTVSKNLVCPCCQSSNYEIHFLKENSYLSTNPEEHLEFCDYYLDKLTNNEVQKLIASNDKAIKLYLSDSLLKQTSKIAKKSLEFKLNKYDYNKPLILYGDVHVKYINENNNIENYLITTINNEIINLGIAKKTKQIIEKKTNINLKDCEKLTISLLAILKREKRFNNVTITKSNCIYFIKC